MTRTTSRLPAHFTRTLTLGAADKTKKVYHSVPVEVPAGTSRLEIRLHYPKADDCVIDLGIGDTELTGFPSDAGLRGWSGGERDWVFLGRDAATPGYQAGPVPAGTWQVFLGLYRMPAEPVEITIEAWFSSEDRPLLEARAVPEPVHRRAGWYRGDLQCHTFHSDAKGAPQHLHATARREGLDFLAVTDHNTVTQQQAYFDAASSERLVFVPAYEFTSERGHANVFGARKVFDFRAETDRDVADMIGRIRASGALFSVNHDKPTIPWRWALPEIDCMEIWQSHWLAGNYLSLGKYQARLAEGRRITAIGGSDFHQPCAEPDDNLFTLARPTTWLWLEELSVPAILAALRAGRSFVTEGPDGPRLELSAGPFRHGDTAMGAIGKWTVRARGAKGDVLHLWDATGRIGEMEIVAQDWTEAVNLDDPRGFVRAEIVADGSRQRLTDELLDFLGEDRRGHSEWDIAASEPIRRALTSPIYLG